jgi:hypothetical protein
MVNPYERVLPDRVMRTSAVPPHTQTLSLRNFTPPPFVESVRVFL